MAFKKGGAKPEKSGRQKGVKNKRTVEMDEIMNRCMLELSGTLETDISIVNSSRRLLILTDIGYFGKSREEPVSLKYVLSHSR